MEDDAPSTGPDETAPVTRAEFERLRRRVDELERALRGPARPPTPAPPAPAVAARAAPPAPPPVLTPTPIPAPAPPPAPAPARPTGRAVGIERFLGERFAPRVGALLVFLATLFFLGVAIQRGWIGPLAQLALAVLVAGGLLGIAAWLTRRKGYGTYPQVLEGTGVCVLYATAFVAYALPYYQEHTRLTDVTGGVLMALVAAGTVGLALARNSRVIVSLGYTLGFITSGLGWGLLPDLTLAYVSILGATLAFVVARKAWLIEGAIGSLVTGVFFVIFAFDAQSPPPAPWAVLAGAAVPAAAFLWVSTKPRSASGKHEVAAALVALVTLAWGAGVTAITIEDPEPTIGGALLAWTAVAAALAALASRRRGEPSAVLAHGAGAIALYAIAAPLLWSEADEAPLLVTLTYAAGALALLAAQRALPRAERGLWMGGLALAALAAWRAVFVDGRVADDVAADAVLGSWQAWVTFAALFPALALLVAFAPKGRASLLAHGAFVLGLVFLAAWAFALFATPFLTTLYLVLVGAAMLVAGTRREGAALARDAIAGGFVLLAFGALKTATYDAHAVEPPMAGWLAAIEAAVVAGILLAFHHAGTARRANLPPLPAGAALVGGSAVVLASFLFAYAEGAWTSILLGALGVAYLAVGFVLKGEDVYRYVGFAALGFVLLRVFTVDLRETDLAIRAAVFAVLGGILLAVGYAYARANRPREPPRATFEQQPPRGPPPGAP